MLLHRYITNAPADLVVDHIDRDSLNNTRSNLRFVSQAENKQNRRKTTSTKSGLRGIFWIEKMKKWRAKVTINKKQFHLGYFSDLQEANKVIVEFRKEHMEFSNEESAL